jgi:hypothetical protein
MPKVYFGAIATQTEVAGRHLKIIMDDPYTLQVCNCRDMIYFG